MSKTKIMRAVCLLLVLLCSSVIALVGCDSKPDNFYSLQEAYDNGWLTQEDLQSIAYYYHDTPKRNQYKDNDFEPIPKQELTRQMERKIRQAHLEDFKKAFPGEKARLNNVYILNYFGTYGDCIVVDVADNIPLCRDPLFIDKKEIGNVMFYSYSEAVLQVYYTGA